MTAKDQAIDIIKEFYNKRPIHAPDCATEIEQAKSYARTSVLLIINANPHSNPLNTGTAESTMEYWQEVLTEIDDV